MQLLCKQKIASSSLVDSTMKENTKDNVTDWEKIHQEVFQKLDDLDEEVSKERLIDESVKIRRKYTEEELLALAEMIRRA